MPKAIEALDILRKRLPTAFPVRLGKPLPKDCEDYSTAKFSGASYILRLRPNLSEGELQDAIVHEYAHFRSWGLLQAQTYDHGPHWGIEYALVYCELIGSS